MSHTLTGHCHLDLLPSFKSYCVRSISLIFFAVGIQNLMCICGVSLYHLWVTVTLTSDLVLIIIVSGAYLILFEIGIPNLVCECILGWWNVSYHIRVTVTMTSDLVFRKIVPGAYLLYYQR